MRTDSPSTTGCWSSTRWRRNGESRRSTQSNGPATCFSAMPLRASTTRCSTWLSTASRWATRTDSGSRPSATTSAVSGAIWTSSAILMRPSIRMRARWIRVLRALAASSGWLSREGCANCVPSLIKHCKIRRLRLSYWRRRGACSS